MQVSKGNISLQYLTAPEGLDLANSPINLTQEIINSFTSALVLNSVPSIMKGVLGVNISDRGTVISLNSWEKYVLI